jgi:hypothetical protein
MAGRLCAWLLICDPPHQSITELASALGVSKGLRKHGVAADASGPAGGRVPVPGSREHHYRVNSGDWASMAQARLMITTMAVDALNEGLAAVGDDPKRRQRLAEVLDFFEFMTVEFGPATTPGYRSGGLAIDGRQRAREALTYLGNLHGDVPAARITELADRLDLDPGRPIRALSKGNRQRSA